MLADTRPRYCTQSLGPSLAEQKAQDVQRYSMAHNALPSVIRKCLLMVQTERMF